jgi:hypothetical protein
MDIHYVLIPFSTKQAAEDVAYRELPYACEVVKEAPCIKKLYEKAEQERHNAKQAA